MPEASTADGTAALWRRRGIGVAALPYTAALIGRDAAELSDAASLSLAASTEAERFLDGMELRIRTLTSTVATETQRCTGSVRGPILWSETITARANALGNDDLFVCMTASRSHDTVENRVLVDALEAVARAGRALRSPTGERVAAADAHRIAAIATEAANWRRHPRLAGIRGGRLRGREVARLRAGHRIARLAPVLAVRARAAEPFQAEDVAGLAGRATRRLHGFVEDVTSELARRALINGWWSFADGGLWCQALSFRHPGAAGSTPPGLCYRGVPLLPPPTVVEDATWGHLLPRDGVHVNSPQDLDTLLNRFSGRRGAAAQRRSSSPSTISS